MRRRNARFVRRRRRIYKKIMGRRDFMRHNFGMLMNDASMADCTKVSHDLVAACEACADGPKNLSLKRSLARQRGALPELPLTKRRLASPPPQKGEASARRP
jgi:hypothetical protein